MAPAAKPADVPTQVQEPGREPKAHRSHRGSGSSAAAAESVLCPVEQVYRSYMLAAAPQGSTLLGGTCRAKRRMGRRRRAGHRRLQQA